jgi:hypothetical protein
MSDCLLACYFRFCFLEVQVRFVIGMLGVLRVIERAGHHMLSGDFVENYEKFEGFFQVLEHPENFRRYKKLVIDRKEFVQPTCSTEWDVVFHDMLERDHERNAELALA